MTDPLRPPTSPLGAAGIGRRGLLASAGALLLGSLATTPALAQSDWPAGKIVTWVVPYPPGGSTDVLGRTVAQRLGTALGTNVIVDNRAGATGTIGAAFVAKAAPDGYTLLGTSIGPQAIAPHLMGKLPYDPIAAFEPVVIIGTIPHILVVGADQPFQTVADLVAAAKAQPGQLAYASGGNGTILQMQGELLQQQTGARFIHVPYKGDTPALQDTLAGQVQFMFAPVAAALPHVQAGKLRALAVTSAQRLKALPAKTPAAVVQRLNQEINKALKDPAVVALADKLGVTLVGGMPKQLGDLQKADSAKWAKVIQDGNIKAE
ncbi:MFS transporter [Paracidovorax avenae]|uniref:Bug family tripartite tricarboxylate transporter substrate binding protein n=1 Tax=Paracidovorax avenae TaxID=80867 RepID=UPI000D218DC4|nr:tripartite tricarboxylate transporter substrate-binding protein [Paracidovorax avenae]AVS84866.1 MFS transporter [Paracidovorax avenae]AVT02567.1 MFS transporter [Paracidovorax avenae]